MKNLLKDFEKKLAGVGVNLPLSENTEILNTPLNLKCGTVKNRIVIQPMEGCDGTPDGGIDVLSRRRYERFAKSGAGLIWFEAVAVANEGRANARQLYLTEKTLDSFKALIDDIKEISMRENGFAPVIIMQATHSGRYSKPRGTSEPMIAHNNPLYETKPIDKARIVSDDYLKSLEGRYAHTASLALSAGFDGIDVKCCHRYLFNELLSAFERPGMYGGSFENRTRMYLNAIESVMSVVPSNFEVTSRLNVYDGFEYPYGFGVSPSGGLCEDLTEPLELVKILCERFSFDLLNVTIGNPYVNPHVNRPFDSGPYEPPENPLFGVERMYRCVGAVQKSQPRLNVVASGVSYLKNHSVNLAAGSIEQGFCSMSGFGRMAFAYPDFAKDVIKNGAIDASKCCIVCSKCSELMRGGSVAGCVIRDAETYMPFYKQIRG